MIYMENVVITLLGTGAADHQWQRIGDPDVRGSAGTLLNRSVLFDYGFTGAANLSRAQVSPDELSAIIFTHSHPDHFDQAGVKALLAARKNSQPLAISGSPELTATLKDAENCLLHPLTPGDKFTIDGMYFTALKANHLLYDPQENAFHYLIETQCGNILYALSRNG